MNSNTPFWIAFNKIRVFNTYILSAFQKELGSLKELWRAEKEDLLDSYTINKISTNEWKKFTEKRMNIDIRNCNLEITVATRNNIKILTPDEPNYPAWLLECMTDAPITLYVSGRLEKDPENSIAIVGTRNPSLYGRTKAREIAEELVKEGFIIVSGLARGIDCAAHIEALDGGGKTIAVLANGLVKHPNDFQKDQNFKSPLNVYPPEHSELVEDIIINGGAIVSESPFGTKARPFRLLARNRIIAGLSRASVAIEGGNKTGTSSEINYAKKMRRRIFALVPKDGTRTVAKFPQELISQGIATPITSGSELILKLHNLPPLRSIDQYV